MTTISSFEGLQTLFSEIPIYSQPFCLLKSLYRSKRIVTELAICTLSIIANSSKCPLHTAS